MKPFSDCFYLVVLLFVLMTAPSGFALSTADTAKCFDAYNAAFYVQSGTNGYFKNTQTDGTEYFWSQAEEIECVIDAYEWTTNTAYLGIITNLLNGFLTDNGSSWTWNMYNDDNMWAVMAFSRGGKDTGNTNYCRIAKANFDAIYARAWDTNLGGGLYWTTDKASKNACVNGPGSIAANLLFQIYGDTNYWNKATNIYYWERSVLFNTGSGAIYDNIGTNGVLSYWSSTYNQGTFIGAANFIGQTNDATLAADFTMLNLTTGGILPQYGIGGNNSGFNAIFLRWMTRFIKNRNLQTIYEPWLQLNAAAAWNSRRMSDNLSWCQWPLQTPLGTNFNSWDCISSMEALEAADPAQTVAPQIEPTDYLGWWPLDASSGTVAVDASGNGNNGTVNEASWNTDGEMNGCLNFNGSNSDVQINNPVSADSSISFWVKTTQTGGTGQWYRGAGLVDGDAPGVADDFGAALVGGKFAFGIGNPDTTLLSNTAINDGAWHLCVATRQQEAGAIHVYVDGVLQATDPANKNTLNASAKLLFGAIASGGGYFNGSLDDVKIFGRALSSDEVAALYLSRTLSPAAPANLIASASGGQIQLNWWETSAAISYNVKRSLVDGGPYATITNVSAPFFTDTNVAASRTYFYVVSAVNLAGEGTNSAQASAGSSAPAVWFKADAITGLNNGARVSIWTDSSGNGYDAAQPQPANQPTYVTGVINGLPVVRFNSTNSAYLWFYRPVQDDFTIICVFQSAKGYGSGNLYYEGAGLVNGEVSGAVNDFGTCLFANGSLCAGTGNPDVGVVSGSGYANGRPHIITFKRTEKIGQVALYVDGILSGTTTGSTASLTSPNQLMLGALQTLINFFDGDIAEVQIYNAALGDTTRVGLENALKCKYGMATAALPAIPAGLAGAAGNRQISLTWLLTPGADDYNLLRSLDGGVTYQEIASGLTTSSFVDDNPLSGQTNYYKLSAADDCGASVESAPANVFLPLPALSMSVRANAIGISWPTWASDWALYTTTNLTSPIVWTPVTNPIGTNNGLLNVTMPMDSQTRFYRLAAP
jgi:predicted alpha-1,6-mannanase (GH76 family)